MNLLKTIDVCPSKNYIDMKQTGVFFLVFGITWAIFSCNNQSQELASETSTPMALSGEYAVDGSIHWAIQGVGHGHDGTIGISKASVGFQDGNIKNASIEIDMNTIHATDLEGDSVQHAKFVGHLRAADFFAIDSFPKAQFIMTAATKDSIQGDMTIKGITKPMAFPYSLQSDSTGFTIKGKMEVDRSLFNVQYGSAKFFDIKKLGDHLVEDIIKMDFELKQSK